MSDNIQTITKDNVEIRVHRDLCISAGPCTVYAPNTFDIDDEGIAAIKDGDWDAFEKIFEAAKSCPVMAIEVYKDGKKIYPEN
ncbi:ferredoxin [candidate division WWE3 bacterium CG_4_9_14_0_2_um_filter_35_11]|uniref:Ferredoxin n=1 Tax=candidate division WWE3 bacterium CG_4_9_14_0_2_um_filter_35_11 TaxID=1975077 RepID=A0A2M8EMG0_UNCKA|nr:MAG: ferredoxin [candidate division WWE3 bacterium CG10_big_fil_rev_8_21_14_0_10_35_32]PJC23905.1 MAG: ferredoxin [candidate division WWE3 bacterium CG_4_9_14_0_2_um_filter_35_11]